MFTFCNGLPKHQTCSIGYQEVWYPRRRDGDARGNLQLAVLQIYRTMIVSVEDAALNVYIFFA